MTASNTSLNYSIPDVIDQLAGIHPRDAADAIRANRPQARLHAQESFLALLGPDAVAPGSLFTAVDRLAVAAFVATLHGQDETVSFYAAGLAQGSASPALAQAVRAEAIASLVAGPYGSYPAGRLTDEDLVGPHYAPAGPARTVFGERLSAALAHAHLLVLHPRDAKASDLQALLGAGWSTTDIVTLSQLVAFLSFQIRVIAGLRALAPRPGAPVEQRAEAATA